MDKVEKSVWIAVDDNLELSEHVSISSALEAATLSVFFEKEGRRLNNGYSNYAYGVEFYNKAGLKVDGIIINDWRLFNVRVYSFSDYVQEKIECSVMDPYGEMSTPLACPTLHICMLDLTKHWSEIELDLLGILELR